MTVESNQEDIVQVSGLKKWFSLRKGFSQLGEEIQVRAVDGVDLHIRDCEVYGIVGESGCGKTTLGRLLVRLLEPTEGQIIFMGDDITNLSRKEMKKLRHKTQIIFQDPFCSLPVRFSAEEILIEPFKIHKMVETEEQGEELVTELLEDVGLVPVEVFSKKYPNQLSGGQRQRLSIARALALKPKFIVADEPVSMLDLSVRAEILNLLCRLKEEHGLTLLLITHDLAIAQFMCDKIAIMYVGVIVERGFGNEILAEPYHPYTMLLKAALPTLDPRTKAHQRKLPTEKEIANPIDIPSGCRFHPRCIYARDICKEVEPELRPYKRRSVACHAVGDWMDPEEQIGEMVE